MSQLSLVAFVPTWVSNWLTPLWILGTGALLGLVALLLLWLVAWALSRIPPLDAIGSDRSRQGVAAGVVSAIALALLVWAVVVPGYPRWDRMEGTSATENTILALCLLVPLSLVLGFGIASYFSRKTVAEAADAVREGPLGWILSITAALACFGVLGYFVAMEPASILSSVSRVPYVGEREHTFTLPPTPRADLDDPGKSPAQHPIDVEFRVNELRSLTFRSDQNLSVDIEPATDVVVDPVFEISAGETFHWTRGAESQLFDQDEVSRLYVRNESTNEAKVSLTVLTTPRHPESLTILGMGLAVLGVFLGYLFQRSVMPKVSAVALSTFKSEVNQPLFMIVLALGLVALALFIFIPYNTFGEDIKVLKDSGMTLIMVLCIIQAIWAASTSVADEIEGKTALTVLSKPIGRRSFILGKYLGIFWTVAVLFLVLGLFLLICVAYKPIYDAREGAEGDPTWSMCHLEMIGVVPGLLLAFMETCVLAAISVAISTRLPMLANFIICFSIYVLGHLTPLVVQSSVNMFEAVRFVAELVATVLPNLEHFNIQAAVAAGVAVPGNYLAWALLYSLIYGFIALLLALVLFEDRDLA